MTVYSIIKEFENTPGTNDKLAILKSHAGNSDLKEFFRLALHPQILFGINKIPEFSTNGIQYGWRNLTSAMAELNVLITRELTGNAAIDHLRMVLSNISPANADLISRIIKKDPNCKVGHKLVNKVWKKLAPEAPYMRCSSANDKNYDRINFPAIVQKKANGLFLNIIHLNGEVTVESRNGNVVEMHGALDDDVKSLLQDRNFVLMGEGLVLDDDGKFLDRKTGNGIINKAIQGTITPKEASRIVVECWDVVKYDHWASGKSNTTYDKRFSMLETIIRQLELFYSMEAERNDIRPHRRAKLRVIESKTVMSFDEANTYYKELLARGEEGAVIKNLNGIWKNHTSPNQVKMKVKDPADLLCVGTTEHTKQPGWIGALVLESSDGVIKVKTGSGLTEADRQKSPDYYIGKIIEVEYNEITDDKKTKQKSLFLPIYVDVRFDKTEADDYKTILERSCVK